MKKIIGVFLSAMIVSQTLFAECKFSTDIVKKETGYLYTNSCHALMGIALRDNDDLKVEVEALRKTIDIQKQVIEKADERTILWRNESYEQFERLQKQAELSSRNEMLWFVLGIVVTSAAVYGAGQLK